MHISLQKSDADKVDKGSLELWYLLIIEIEISETRDSGRYESHPHTLPIARLSRLICRGPHAPVLLTLLRCTVTKRLTQVSEGVVMRPTPSFLRSTKTEVSTIFGSRDNGQ